ncbi:MAG: TrbI/VirB10 family protein [Deltaproteobacteria bacterium]
MKTGDKKRGLPRAEERGAPDEVEAAVVASQAMSRATTVVEAAEPVEAPRGFEAVEVDHVDSDLTLEEAAQRIVAPEDEGAQVVGFEHPEASTAPDHRTIAPRVTGWRALVEGLEQRRGLQFGLLVATGLFGWWVFGAPVEAPTPEAKPATKKKATGFPVFKSEAEDGVAEQDIGELLRQAAAKEARREAEQRALDEALVEDDDVPARRVLRPGEIYDPMADATIDVPRAPTPRALPGAERAPVDQSIFFAPGGVLELPEGYGVEAKERGLGLPVGTRLKAKLLVGASSANRSPVLAKVTEPVRVGGSVKVKAGAILRGRANADASTGRLYIDFEEVRMNQERYALQGYAISHGDMPGLVARRREASLEDRVGAGGLGGAVGAGGEIASEVAGSGVVGKVVRRVAQGTVPEAQRELEADRRGVTYEVAAGTAFEVLVVGDER